MDKNDTSSMFVRSLERKIKEKMPKLDRMAQEALARMRPRILDADE